MAKKEKKEYSEDESDSENEIKEKLLKKKKDGRSISSKQNSIKAREAKLNKLKQAKMDEKEKQHTKIKETFHPPQNYTPMQNYHPSQYNDIQNDDEEEILIINPPPMDIEKLQKKNKYYQNLQEIYEWMQQEKVRKGSKQPKYETQTSSPVVINMGQSAPIPIPITKEMTEDEKLLQAKILQKCTTTPHIKF
jgi:hypothetical protein